MALHPSHAYRRNLERIGPEIPSGFWRITPLGDAISEKRYLLLSVKSRSVAEFAPSALVFRGEAAATIAPEQCARVLSSTVEGDRAEILIDHLELIDGEPDDTQLRAVLDFLLTTLHRFEAAGFFATELSTQSVGRNSGGELKLLPNAYIVPSFGISDAAGGTQRPSAGRTGRFELPAALDAGSYHARVIARFIQRLGGTAAASGTASSLRVRAAQVAESILKGEIASVAETYERILGAPLDGAQPPERPTAQPSAAFNAIAAGLDGEASVIVANGSGDVLRDSVTRLRRDHLREIIDLDEWELFARPRKSAMSKVRASSPVWVVEDIEEKAVAYSDFALAMLGSDSFPKGTVVLGCDRKTLSTATREFLQMLKARRGKSIREIELPEDPLRMAPTPIAEVTQDEAARRVLELVTVAQFALPLDILLTVFADSAETTCATIQSLASAGAVRVVYRAVPGKSTVGVFVTIRNAATRRELYGNIPDARRRRLHRTVALLCEQQTTFPPFFLLLHSLEAGDTERAARRLVAYVREAKPGHRHERLLKMCETLVAKGDFDLLPFADRVFVCSELASEMLRKGRESDAERVLQDASEFIEEDDGDQVLKNASLVCSVYRMLAERREARGEFKRALSYLSLAREQLESALSIPDQARLLNDIGWMQYRLGDYEKSMESCRLSLNTLDASQYPLIVAQALNLMGVVHFNTSRYDEAVSYYEQSAHLRERAGEENALAASFNNLALAYQSKGEFERALDYYNRSLELKRRQNNREGMAGGYLNLALLYLEAGNLKEAEARCRESIAISEEIGNAQLTADNHITLGDIALEGGDLDTAEHEYQKSRRISHQLEAINEEMGALRRLSSICLRRNRYDEAREYADKAHELVQRIGSRYEAAQIDVILGDLEAQQGHHPEALEHYERAAGEYTTLSKYRLAATVLSKIGLIQADKGNVFEAKHYFERAHDFVRADLGRELPDEFVRLQQALRAQPTRTQFGGKDSQKLLMAFYELSALTDFAADRHEFFRKFMDVVHQVAAPNDCYLAIRTEPGSFAVFDSAGERRPGLPKDIVDVLERTILGGGVLDSRTDAAKSRRRAGGNDFVCIALKAMSEDLGCLFLQMTEDRLPLSKDDVNFFTWLGRQLGGNLKLMLHMNEDLLEELAGADTGAASRTQRHQRFETLIGKSESMKAIFRTLEKVKDHDSGILILGESGTGKSALARAIHYNSPRGKNPFQEIHCAQIPHNLLESELFGHERGSFTGAVQRKPGLCEIANRGTLFLDDINVMPVETQTKLLHFIESKSFMRLGGTQRLSSDVRIIAAANEDLERLCREGKFREDLYYRLKVILVHLPPLRERKEDMLAIALHYIKRSCADKGIPLKTLAPETIQLFKKAPWRGNVRELQNVLERIVVLSDETLISPASLPEDFLKESLGKSRHTYQRIEELADEIVKLGSYSEANPLLPVLEAVLAKRMVDHVNGKARAASMLGISKPTLYARLRDYDKMH